MAKRKSKTSTNERIASELAVERKVRTILARELDSLDQDSRDLLPEQPKINSRTLLPEVGPL